MEVMKHVIKAAQENLENERELQKGMYISLKRGSREPFRVPWNSLLFFRGDWATACQCQSRGVTRGKHHPKEANHLGRGWREWGYPPREIPRLCCPGGLSLRPGSPCAQPQPCHPFNGFRQFAWEVLWSEWECLPVAVFRPVYHGWSASAVFTCRQVTCYFNHVWQSSSLTICIFCTLQEVYPSCPPFSSWLLDWSGSWHQRKQSVCLALWTLPCSVWNNCAPAPSLETLPVPRIGSVYCRALWLLSLMMLQNVSNAHLV